MATHRAPSLTVAEISDALKADPEAFATNIIGEPPSYRAGTHVRYFENQSLAVYVGGPFKGRYKWFSSDDSESRGDMLDLYVLQHGGSMGDALKYARSFLGKTAGNGPLPKANLPSRKEAEAEMAADAAKRTATAREIWASASPTQGREAGRAYLAARGITADLPDTTLRYRTLSRRDLDRLGCQKHDASAKPATALVFAARGDDGEVCAVQQVFTADSARLRDDSGRKVPKKTNGVIGGHGVWFGDPTQSPRVALAEGPETGLSVFEATDLPTCVTLSSSNFSNLALPASVESLVIAADMEATGRGLAAAIGAAQRHHREGGRACGIAVPPLRDGDFNDIHRDRGTKAVADLMARAYFPPERDPDGTLLVTADSRAAFHAWARTGIEVAARVPPTREGKFRPLNLLNAVREDHNRVLVIETPGIEVSYDALRTGRPDVEVHTIHTDSREFRKVARNSDALVRCINAPDLHIPGDLGTDGPIFFALRRRDADALAEAGKAAVGVRAAAIDRLDLSFARGRTAILAPIGNGTSHDDRLEAALGQAGATCERLTWQLFRGDAAESPRLLRTRVPDTFGAAEAAAEGWTGAALDDLVAISRANRAQIAAGREARAPQGRADTATAGSGRPRRARESESR